jgi:hypothetical protein
MANKPNLLEPRLEAMWALLTWEGEISNRRLRTLFGLQIVQASRLLGMFRERWPKALEFSTARRAYVATPAASRKPAFPPRFENYLELCRSSAGGGGVLEDWRVDLTHVDPAIFRVLYAACETGAKVRIRYRSMNNPEPAIRTLAPHAMVGVGRRWHVRAWSDDRGEFRDFVLGRISSASRLDESASTSGASDKAWTRHVSVRLVPHRALSKAQADVIREELLQGRTALEISVRECLVQYVIQDLRASTHPEAERPPGYQVEVANMGELASVLFTAD